MRIRKLFAIPLTLCMLATSLSIQVSAVDVERTHGDSTISGKVNTVYTPTAKSDDYCVMYKYAATSDGQFSVDVTSKKELKGSVKVDIKEVIENGYSSMSLTYDAECFDENGNFDVWTALAHSLAAEGAFSGANITGEMLKALYEGNGTIADTDLATEYEKALSTIPTDEAEQLQNMLPWALSLTVSTMTAPMELEEGSEVWVTVTFEEKGDSLCLKMNSDATFATVDTSYASNYFNLRSTVDSKMTVYGGTNAVYYSSNSKIASVNSKGVVTMKSKGTAVITVKNNGYTYKYRIKVN